MHYDRRALHSQKQLDLREAGQCMKRLEQRLVWFRCLRRKLGLAVASAVKADASFLGDPS